MQYILNTGHAIPEAVERLSEALAKRKFGVLHIHDLNKTLNSKGVPFEPGCQVLEVCNPQQAAKVLSNDMNLNMALPCRISVYENEGQICIGMISPKEMLKGLSDSPDLANVADEVESVLKEAIDEAAQ
jgi:uncharacterized protein (DUF302 family)